MIIEQKKQNLDKERKEDLFLIKNELILLYSSITTS